MPNNVWFKSFYELAEADELRWFRKPMSFCDDRSVERLLAKMQDECQERESETESEPELEESGNEGYNLAKAGSLSMEISTVDAKHVEIGHVIMGCDGRWDEVVSVFHFARSNGMPNVEVKLRNTPGRHWACYSIHLAVIRRVVV
jgi:hypothetical protein